MKPLLLFALFLLLCACKQRPATEKVTDNSLYHKAFDFKDANQLDSAFLYFSKAKEHFLQNKDNFSLGKCLVNMGMISTTNGDYFGGQEASLEAIRYFDPENKNHHFYILTNYNNLGLASAFLGNLQQSIGFYQKCLPFAEDVEAACVVKNNIANIYRKKLDYPKAISIYDSILKKDISKRDYARVLSNLAFTKWLSRSSFDALPNLHAALKIRIQENDLWGQNASYAHLSDFHLKSRPDSGLFYAQKMYEVAKGLKSGSDQMQAIEKLIRVGPAKEVQQHFTSYKKLDDSIQNAHAQAKNQFAVIRYETEKHKTNFLTAQVENDEKKRKINTQWLLIAVLISVTIPVFLWLKRRHTVVQQQKELEIKETELRYVKKIHDRVANKVYQVMAEVENIPELNKEEILDKLEIIYGISRDISYEPYRGEHEDNIALQIERMLKSYSAPHLKIAIEGNSPLLWENITQEVGLEVFCALQELMTNMSKHSKADEVSFEFQRNFDEVKIKYLDNGVGLNKKAKFNNGLQNTGNRIKSINGSIIFDQEMEKGLKILISFPVPQIDK